MSNDFSAKTAEQLLAAGNQISTVITSALNGYGVTAGELTALTGADTALNAAINAQFNAKAAEKAATQTKKTDRLATLAAIQAISATVYANPAVTNTMLAAIGFAPRRSGSGTPAVPVTPTSLVATPFAAGTVKLTWNRNGNASGIVFLIEWSTDGTTWQFLKSTTRISYTANGFAPGVQAWFRVTATTSTATSVPTSSVSVYAPAPPVSQLRVA